MTASAVEPPVTSARAEQNGDGLYEVVYGRVVEKDMSFFAAWVASRLMTSLSPFVESHRLGTAVLEAIFILDPVADLRRRPDVAFLSTATWPLEQPFPKTGDLTVCPDLAVEVTSPNDLIRNVHEKLEEYFRYGSRQVWLVLPETERVHIYTSPTSIRVLTVNDTLDGGDMIPGWSMPVANLFSR